LNFGISDISEINCTFLQAWAITLEYGIFSPLSQDIVQQLVLALTCTTSLLTFSWFSSIVSHLKEKKPLVAGSNPAAGS